MDRFKIKVLMAIFFLLGSIAYIPHVPFVFNYPGIIVMPVIVFLVVEGYYHTSSKDKYLRRMMIGGEAMLIVNLILSLIFMSSSNGRVNYNEIGIKGYICFGILIILTLIFLILNLKGMFLTDKAAIIFIFIMSAGTLILNISIDNKINILRDNMFIVLAGVIILLKALDQRRENRADKKAFSRSTIKALIIFSVCMLTQSLILAPAFALIVYVFRNNKRMIITGLFVLSGLCIPGFTIKELLAYPQWMMFFGIIFILLYNGQEGLKIKKPFYYIYPVMVWIPFIIGSLMK